MGKPVTLEDSEVSISITADLQLVRPLRHFLTALCAIAEYPEEEIDTLALVVTEIINNSIEHGCNNPTDEVRLVFAVTPDLFRFEVMDAGRGGQEFAACAVELASKMPDLDEPRGRGLFLIKSYMDEFKVNYEKGAGTRVYISKRRES